LLNLGIIDYDNMTDNNIEQLLKDIKEIGQKNQEYLKSIKESLPINEERFLDEINKRLNDNLEHSKAVFVAVKKIKKWMAWQRVVGMLKWVIILIPIGLGIIYLPVLSEIVDQLMDNIEALRQSQEAINQLQVK